MGSVSIQDTHKSYGAVPVLHGVSVDIEDGEFVVLVGPSGCGKSTLLRMIAGLEHITSGDIVIGDRIVNGVPPKDRDIAMVFQNYALYPHMTVAQNMSFSLRLAGSSKAEIARKVRDAAAILALEPYLERYPRQLSGGQRQRVAMGRAIVRDPAVFLFDEPLSNLDAKLRVQMRTEIKTLHHRLKTTTIYVTHDQIEAMTMADRIVVMRDGVIMQIGTPLDLYDRPENLFVAGFIGSPAMNLIEGIMKDDDVPYLEAGVTRIPVPEAPAGSIGKAVTIGIRPEDFIIDSDGVQGKVLVVEPTGAELQIHADIGPAQVTALFRERHDFRTGDDISLKALPGKVHIFDQESGQRILSDR